MFIFLYVILVNHLPKRRSNRRFNIRPMFVKFVAHSLIFIHFFISHKRVFVFTSLVWRSMTSLSSVPSSIWLFQVAWVIPPFQVKFIGHVPFSHCLIKSWYLIGGSGFVGSLGQFKMVSSNLESSIPRGHGSLQPFGVPLPPSPYVWRKVTPGTFLWWVSLKALEAPIRARTDFII